MKSYVVEPTEYIPSPASGDLSSHPELTAWMS